ncbi:MAG: restriction endonuclease subunit S [Calditrichaeota bacterium]|nr:MAG: restriction endonuclease subunit S [Calditrichota bacterium]
MKKEWQVESFGKLFTIRPQKKEAYNSLNKNDIVSFVPMSDLKEKAKGLSLTQAKKLSEVYSGYTYFADNDVLLAKITPCFENGKLGIAQNLENGIGFGSSEFIVFRANGRVIPEYLFYFLSNEKFRQAGKKQMTGAVGHKRVPKDFIENYKLPFPTSIEEQKRIVAILDKAFAAIDQARANAQKNLQNSRELFESYLNKVFANPGEDWEEKKLSEVSQFINGKAYSKKELLNRGKYRVLRVGNFFTNNNWYYSDLELPPDKYCENGDLLYAWSASFGPRIWTGEKVIYHYHIWKVIPDTSYITKEFLYFLLEWDVEKIKSEQGAGTTMIHVTKGSMENRNVFIPPIGIQESIVSKTKIMIKETNRLKEIYQKKITDLEELKKSILHKAFEGEL